MADDKKDFNELKDISQNTNTTIYGSDSKFEKDNDLAISIVNDTIRNIKKRYTDRTGDEGLVDYARSAKFQSVFLNSNGEDVEPDNKTNTVINNSKFKDLMTERGFQHLNNLVVSDNGRITTYRNYRAVYEHIPQAAQACDLFVNNITSPDDFTKTIFDVEYRDITNNERKLDIDKKVNRLTSKYELEELANEIIHTALIDGDVYLNVASIEDDINYMLNKFDGSEIITESYLIDEANDDAYVDGWVLTEAQQEAFHSLYEENEDAETELTESQMRQDIVDLVNDRVTIIDSRASRIEFLSSLRDQNYQQLNEDISTGYDPLDIIKKKRLDGKETEYNSDDNPIGYNGSSLNILDSTRIIELDINGKNFGYYYIEEDNNKPKYTSRFQQKMYGSAIDLNNSKFSPDRLNKDNDIDEGKEELIKSVFVDTIAKKLNKDFLRHNKEFKDYIYQLIKKKYITEKAVKIMYFRPDEIIPFHVPSIYSKVLFFVSLYIAMLSNEILIKMGRGHDKRVYYIESGLDGNYEQAIMSVVQDIKTKEFKLDSISDISTILNLNPGRFDDYFIPMSDGNRAMDIDTLAGMDSDLNSEFLEFLLNSILAGIGVPASIIDAANNEIDYARTLSAQNGNFVREVIKYQKSRNKFF